MFLLAAGPRSQAWTRYRGELPNARSQEQSRARRALVAWQEGRLASEQRCRARGQGTVRTTGGQYAPARPQLPEEEVVGYRTREVPGKAGPRGNRWHLP